MYQTSRPKALQSVSEDTKNKLNRFQYLPRTDESAQEDVAGNKDSTTTSEAQQPTPSRGTKTEAVTPMTRLNWRDLMEPASASNEEETTHVSPNERLLWDNRQDSLYTSALSPMMLRKSKKRARSSSPISSPAAEKTTKPAVNVKKLAQALKSPHADPTLELWDRYSLNGPTSDDAGIASPALAQLMVSSSPRPSKGSNAQPNDGNLRRAISCGLNWPKRRKLEKSISGTRVSGEQQEPETTSKSSLVTALLDTVTNSIHGDVEEEAEEMFGDQPSPSPKKRRVCATATGSPRRIRPKDPPQKPLSDFDVDEFDDEFDDDTLVELEASIAATQHPTLPEGDRVDMPILVESPPKRNSSLDEFEDLGDDEFDDADLLTVVEDSFKSADPLQTPKAQTTKISVTKDEPGDFDDDFGDAFGGDFDFEAVELAATQAMKQSHNTPADVRRQTTPR